MTDEEYEKLYPEYRCRNGVLYLRDWRLGTKKEAVIITGDWPGLRLSPEDADEFTEGDV